MDLYNLHYVLLTPKDTACSFYLAKLTAMPVLCDAWGGTPQQALISAAAIAQLLLRDTRTRGDAFPPAITRMREPQGTITVVHADGNPPAPDLYELDYVLHQPTKDHDWMYWGQIPAIQGCMAWEATPEETISTLRAVAGGLIATSIELTGNLPETLKPLRSSFGTVTVAP